MGKITSDNIRESMFGKKKKAFLFYSSFYTDVISALDNEEEKIKLLWMILDYTFAEDFNFERLSKDESLMLEWVFHSIDAQIRRYESGYLLEDIKGKVARYQTRCRKKGIERECILCDEAMKHLKKLSADVKRKDISFDDVCTRVCEILKITGLDFDKYAKEIMDEKKKGEANYAE